MAERHTHAKGLIADAAERLRQPGYHSQLESMGEQELRVWMVTLMEQNIVVSGAVLDEVGHGGHIGGLTVNVSSRAVGLILTMCIGGIGLFAALRTLEIL